MRPATAAVVRAPRPAPAAWAPRALVALAVPVVRVALVARAVPVVPVALVARAVPVAPVVRVAPAALVADRVVRADARAVATVGSADASTRPPRPRGSPRRALARWSRAAK
jgi:hypothetical protein